MSYARSARVRQLFVQVIPPLWKCGISQVILPYSHNVILYITLCHHDLYVIGIFLSEFCGRCPNPVLSRCDTHAYAIVEFLCGIIGGRSLWVSVTPV